MMSVIIFCPCIYADQDYSIQQAPLLSIGTQKPKVDFSYAFGMPHRLTVALPDSSDKTLLDVRPDCLSMSWSYDDLRHTPLASYLAVRTSWYMNVWPELDGKKLPSTHYGRAENSLPVLDINFEGDHGSVKLETVGGKTAAITKIELINNDVSEHQFSLVSDVNGFGEVPGYVEKKLATDYILAGWGDAADRVLVLGIGAQEFPVHGNNSIALKWTLAPGQSRIGWLIRPYRGYEADIAKLRTQDWSRQFQDSKRVWQDLLSRAVRIQIPDDGVANAYYAGLADIFIMREPVADGYIAGVPGTEMYRAAEPYEPGIAAIALDQAGLHDDARNGYQMCLDQQGVNGDWADPKGWGHRFWASSGFKAWVIMEHYKLTNDKKYLKQCYPRMLASSRFQELQRTKTRMLENGNRPLTYGLMPRGVGDCGLDAGDGWYGVFYPHNIWSVYGDKMTLEAARFLGKSKDIAELERIYNQAYKDLLTSLEKGSIQEKDYRWLPGSPACKLGSRWGVLNAAFPCRLLAPDDELITGTLKFIESQMSPGGIPIHTGWMIDGMWVAIALDNVAEVKLVRGEGDAFAAYLYSVLNHGTPLYSWCEERGQQPGTQKTSGDRQHLWTPVAVVRGIRDCLVFEDGNDLHLARGTDCSWLASGKSVGISKAPTHFGAVTYSVAYNALNNTVSGFVDFPKSPTLSSGILHIRMPGNRRIKSLSTGLHTEIINDGQAIKLLKPAGEFQFIAQLEN